MNTKKLTLAVFPISLIILHLLYLPACTLSPLTETEEKPNVILILTDDQGIGDFGFMGNPYIKTPNLDQLASQSLSLTNFYVSPVCAPTRACLMTGRYSERTGVYDTYNGGAVMSPAEVTIAEVLKENDYETGIFGKWHLGDNYPYRPSDQGFGFSLVHRAGGMGQPGDIMNYYAMDSSYFNPVLFENDIPVQTKGYCSDVFTNGAIDFIRKNQAKDYPDPFFIYLAFNAPHTPLQLPEEYYNLYKEIKFNADSFKTFDKIIDKMNLQETEAAKRVYGMVTNIDDNIGRLMETLIEEEIYDNTVLVFLTDNGPQQNRYKLGLKRKKSSVYGGGVRVPCLFHYPGKIKAGSELTENFAHIDIFPSILDLCHIEIPDTKIDGISIFDEKDRHSPRLRERPLFFEWGRGYLSRYWNFAALKHNFKLIGNTGYNSDIEDFELYNILNDPGEEEDILSANLQKAEELKKEMDRWYEEIVSDENNRSPLPAYLGTAFENPVLLNRNDAKGTPPSWTNTHDLNYWDVRVARDGVYNIRYHFFSTIKKPGTVILKLNPYHFIKENKEPVHDFIFQKLRIRKGDYQLMPYYSANDGEKIFPFYVSVERVEDENL